MGDANVSQLFDSRFAQVLRGSCLSMELPSRIAFWLKHLLGNNTDLLSEEWLF